MARFVFRLDPVLGYRQRLEDEQQQVLAAAMMVVRAAEGLRDDYIARRTAMRTHILTHHRKMEVADLRASYAHCDYLDRAIVAQQRVVDEARADADRERVKLILKTKDKKIIATLRERREEIFLAEAAANEQMESDDINARRFDRLPVTLENPS